MDKKGTSKMAGFYEKNETNTEKIGKSYLLGIGINEYKHFTEIHNAVKDVNDLANLLFDKYDFVKESPSKLILNEEATREKIKSALHEFCNKAVFKPEDRLLIYYSGHGFWDKGTETGSWVPIDGVLEKSFDFIQSYEIQNKVSSMPFRHILIISDSCFSSSLLVRGTKGDSGAFSDWAKLKSRYVFASGKGLVLDGKRGGNSPFLKAVLKILRDNNDFLNIASLADRVTKFVSFNNEQTAEASPLYKTGHEGGQFIFYPKQPDKEHWLKAQKTNTILAFNKFIADYPESEFVEKAEIQINRIDEQKEIKGWELARTTNDIPAFNKFIADFSKSKFVEKAQQQLKYLIEIKETKEWRITENLDSIVAIDKFIDKYSHGQYIQEARKKRAQLQEKIDWETTINTNTIVAFEKFKRLYPKSQLVEEAQQSIELIKEVEELKDWNKAKSENSIIAYKKFIRRHTKGSYTLMAKKRLERLEAEEKLEGLETIASLDDFIEKTVYNDLKKEAEHKLQVLEDKTEWIKALRKNTIGGFNQYLNRFPNGSFVKDARSKKKIILVEIESSGKIENDKISQNFVPKDSEKPPVKNDKKALLVNSINQGKIFINESVKKLKPKINIKPRLHFSTKQKKYLIGGVALLFCILMLIQAVSFFMEKEAYQLAKEKVNIPTCESFLDQYPQSVYRPEIDSLLSYLHGEVTRLLINADGVKGVDIEQAKENLLEGLRIDPMNDSIKVKLEQIDLLDNANKVIKNIKK